MQKTTIEDCSEKYEIHAKYWLFYCKWNNVNIKILIKRFITNG